MSINEQALAEFQTWLIKDLGYTNRVARDILSRLRRVDRLSCITDDLDPNKYLFDLSMQDDFGRLNIFIKSHLRKAIRLYYQFTSS